MDSIKNKNVVITGASRGIGAATAKYFAQKGAKVLLLARSSKDIIQLADMINQTGGTAEAKSCDVTDYAQVEEVMAHCVTTFGSLDILINNAGVIEPICRLAESDVDQWTKAVDINYKGVYHGLRAAIPHMLKNNQGAIVNISSGAAVSALEGWSHYCSSKAAALSLTKCVDKEYRDSGIHVVGLSPGTVATDMQVVIKASGVNPVSQLDPSVHIPAEWVAKAAAWLCTDQAVEFAGTDFSLRAQENRVRLNLPID